MKIAEIEWIKQNRDKLDEEDVKALNGFDFFKQLEYGELDLPMTDMMKLMLLLIEIVEKHGGNND